MEKTNETELETKTDEATEAKPFVIKVRSKLRAGARQGGGFDNDAGGHDGNGGWC